MKALFTSTLLLISLFAFSAKYFISPSGSDGSGAGTNASPWFTITKAWTAVSAGDTIIIKGGTYRYTSRPEMVNKSGTANSRIVVMGEPGTRPVISRTTGDYGINIGILIRKCNYVTVRDLDISGFYQPSTTTNLISGLLCDSSGYCHFINLQVHDNGNGLRVQGDSPGTRVDGCDFYRNSDPYSSYGNADGLQIAFTTLRANTDTSWVTNNRAWWNSDDGFDFYQNQGIVIMDNNWSFWNGYQPGNFLNAGNGNGVKIGPTASYPTSKRRIIKNMLVFQNRNDGLDINGARCIIEILNATAYKNGTGANQYGIKLSDDTYAEHMAHIVTNCLSYGNSYGNVNLTSYTVCTTSSHLSNNSTNPAYTITAADFLSTDTLSVNGSRTSSGAFPLINLMRLADGSDLINAGTNTSGQEYSGTARDIGYHEYYSYTASTPDPGFKKSRKKSIVSRLKFVK